MAECSVHFLGFSLAIVNTTVVSNLDIYLSFPKLLDISLVEITRAKIWEMYVLKVCDTWRYLIFRYIFHGHFSWHLQSLSLKWWPLGLLKESVAGWLNTVISYCYCLSAVEGDAKRCREVSYLEAASHSQELLLDNINDLIGTQPG